MARLSSGTSRIIRQAENLLAYLKKVNKVPKSTGLSNPCRLLTRRYAMYSVWILAQYFGCREKWLFFISLFFNVWQTRMDVGGCWQTCCFLLLLYRRLVVIMWFSFTSQQSKIAKLDPRRRKFLYSPPPYSCSTLYATIKSKLWGKFIHDLHWVKVSTK